MAAPSAGRHDQPAGPHADILGVTPLALDGAGPHPAARRPWGTVEANLRSPWNFQELRGRGGWRRERIKGWLSALGREQAPMPDPVS